MKTAWKLSSDSKDESVNILTVQPLPQFVVSSDGMLMNGERSDGRYIRMYR